MHKAVSDFLCRLFLFSRNVGKEQGDEAQLKAFLFHHPSPPWHANDLAAKQARVSEQELSQCRHAGQGSRKAREAVEGNSLQSSM